MITIAAEWIRGRWTELSTQGHISIPLSRWDSGDAYTQSELGPLAGPEQVIGCLVFAGTPDDNAQVVVSLSAHLGARESHTFTGLDGHTYAAAARCLERDSYRALDVQIVEVTAALAERRTALLESSLLADAHVGVIGLGTGGIHIAVELAKAGVGRFTLVDGQRLEVGNVARHHAGISLTGRRKVNVARDIIHEKNPDARIEVCVAEANPKTESLMRAIIASVDVLVCAADGRPAKLFVNRLAVDLGKVAVYGGAFRRAYGGQVLIVRPGRSPCYQCFVMAMPEEAADQEITSAAEAEEIAYTDRPVPVEPGLSLDVAPISLMVAKLALNELIKDRPTTLVSLERDLAAPWYLWINRPEPGTTYAAWPPLSESSDDMTILRWYGIDFGRDTSCPVCGDFASAMQAEYGLAGLNNQSLPQAPADGRIPRGDD
jgi:molybdopterin/thiamine biosynthesis adenylyltransferase